MKAVDVHLAAMDVLDVAFAGRPTPKEVLDEVRADLEVLAREDLIRVLATVAADASFAAGEARRPRMRERLSKMRLEAMLEGSQ